MDKPFELDGLALKVAKYLAIRDRKEKLINCDFEQLPICDKEVYKQEALDLIQIIGHTK